MTHIVRSAATLTVCVGLGACGGGAATGPDPNAAKSVDADLGAQEAYAREHNLQLKVFDLNRDELPDIFKFYRMVTEPGATEPVELLVRKEVDITHDGKIDVIELWDDAGERIEKLSDLDFDGRIDQRTFFKGSEVVRKEVDLNYDGKPDVFKYFDGGKLDRIESDRDFDGRIDTWEYFEGDALDRIGTDTDGDGEVDTWEQKRQRDAPGDQVEAPVGATGENADDAQTDDETPPEGAADSDESGDAATPP